MPNVRRSVVRANRPPVVAMGLGVVLVTAGFAVLDFWRHQTAAAARAMSQYHAAADALAQLKREWNRTVEDLARTNRTIAWREARIEEANEITAELKSQAAGAESRALDDDVAGLCEVCITEENVNLVLACRQRAQLAEQKSQIEQKIAAHEMAIRRFAGPIDKGQ